MYMIRTDWLTHYMLGTAAACAVAAIGREVYGWQQRGRTMTTRDWRESAFDIAFTLAGGAVVLAAAWLGLV
jgi:hypothetical protein